MMNKNVLYLSYDGMTDPLGQSQVLPYIVGLSKLGYNFTLISCEKPTKFKQFRNLIQYICDEHKIDWHPIKYTKSPPVFSTAFDLKVMRNAAKKLHGQKHFSLVHCRGHVPALVGLVLKRKYKIPFLFDLRGFWPDEKVDAGSWNLSNPIYNIIYKYFKYKERQFLKESDHLVSLTYRAKQEILKWNISGFSPEKITIIPCCVDTEHFNPSAISEVTKQSLKTELGIEENDMVISYLGSIGTWYMLDEMLAFFKELTAHFSNAKILFISYDEHDRIKNTAQRLGINSSQLIIRPGIRKEVPALISISKFSIFFIRPTYSKMSSSPTKQGELMAMGVPVICNSGIGDTDKIVLDFQSGIIVDKFNQSDFLKTVDIMKKNNFDRNEIREGALSYFDLSSGIDSYYSIYKNIEI